MQCGFREQRSTTDHLHTTLLLLSEKLPPYEICGCGGGLLVASINALHLLEIYYRYFVCAADARSVSDS